MANFSGFLTNFISTNGGSGDFTDILSDLETGTSQYIGVKGGSPTDIVINWKYFYLGNLLIQFTNNINNANLTGSGTYTLNYGLSYNSTPYFISLTPVDIDNSGAAYVTLTNIAQNHFDFYISGGGSLTALVIGST